MNFVFYILVLLINSSRGDWDLAVLTSSTLELLGQGNLETPLHSHHLGVKEITALTYDPLLLHHYFAASGHKNASIFRVQVSRDGRMGPLEPLVKKQPGKVFGLAFDAETTSVFWTSSTKIYRSQLDVGLTDAQVVHSFDDEIPTAIVVEPCSRYIYWSYHHGAIDRSLMDGTKKERVVDKLFLPVALYISQAERMIYWVDEGPGVSFSIGRALLDGSNKENVLLDTNQQPTSLVVKSLGHHESVIYWTDRVSMKLWSFSQNDTSPVPVHSFEEPLLAVTSATSFEHLDKHVCSKLIAMRDEVSSSAINPTIAPCVHGTYSSRSGSCICNPGYIGDLCETSICYNYCLTGKCSMTNGKPYCRCPPGKTGLRCEVDRCRGYCFHGGCSIDESDQLSCSCHPGWYGPRCNYSEQYCAYACQSEIEEQDFCSCNVSRPAALTASKPNDSKINYKLGFIVTTGTCVVMFLCLIVLVIKTWKLGKRPRVKRFYKVTPNKGSAPQAVRTSPDCQIAIENCCNMNICETPCYEPELRPAGGKSKKEEKRGLLKEMEVQPDLGKTF